jgi:hypothetical protein
MLLIASFIFDIAFLGYVIYLRRKEVQEFEQFKEETHKQFVALAERIDIVLETKE